MDIEKFGSIVIFESQEFAPDGIRMTLAFDTKKKTLTYVIKVKRPDPLNTLNQTFKGTYEVVDTNTLRFRFTQLRDLWYGSNYQEFSEPKIFEIGYKLVDGVLMMDMVLSEIQWGDVPNREGFNTNCYQCYKIKL
jgi:hypothetical protein